MLSSPQEAESKRMHVMPSMPSRRGAGERGASPFGVQVLDAKLTPNGVFGGIAVCKSLISLVGPPGFEPGTSCTPSKKYQSLTGSPL